MEIKIEDYLDDEEIKDIVTQELRKHVRNCVGDLSVSSDVGRIFVSKLAKNLAKEGVQEIIPDFKEQINEQIVLEIKNIKLSQMFFEAFGWRSTGNKIFKEVLEDNKGLLDAKMKELFKVMDK